MTHHGPSRWLRAGLALGVMLIAACGVGDDGAATTGSPTQETTTTASAVTTVPATTAPGGSGTQAWVARYVEPEDGLDQLGSAEVIGVTETADPSRVMITYWAGAEDCYGLDRVDVDEASEEVLLDVVVGRRVPEDTACIAIAQRYATIVELEEPLGDRSATFDDGDPGEDGNG